VGGIGHHPGALPGRENATLAEPTSSHAKCLTAKREATPTSIAPVLARREGLGTLHFPWGTATIVPEAQRVGGLSRSSPARLIYAGVRDTVLGIVC